MVDWDEMSRAKQIISVLPEQSFLGRLDGANLVVITTDAVHGGQGGGGGEHQENCFIAFNYCKNLNYMSSYLSLISIINKTDFAPISCCWGKPRRVSPVFFFVFA